jgi:polyisoprenoid-binding protein YceI
VKPRRGDSYDVIGDLTIHGVTRQVTLPVSYLGRAHDPWGNEKVGFEAELTINRINDWEIGRLGDWKISE